MTNVVNIITSIIGLEREGSINYSMLYQHNYVQIMIDWGRQSKGETHTVNTHIYYFSYATRVPDFCQYPMTKLTLKNWQSRTSINNTSSYYQITSRNCSHHIQALLQKIDKGIWNQTTATIWHSFWAENHDCLNISSVPIYQIRWQGKISQHSDGIWPGQPTLMIAALKGYFQIPVVKAWCWTAAMTTIKQFVFEFEKGIIPNRKGQYGRKPFHAMTSPCVADFDNERSLRPLP